MGGEGSGDTETLRGQDAVVVVVRVCWVPLPRSKVFLEECERKMPNQLHLSEVASVKSACYITK